MDNLIIEINENKVKEATNRRFIKAIIEKTCDKMEEYTKRMIDLGYTEIAYEHSELSVKTFISSALDNITKSCFLQEHYVIRENKKRSGRVDFWSSYNKIDYVMELKKTKAYYNSKTKNLTRWYRTENALIKSKEQIGNVGKHFKEKRELYGINLVLTQMDSEIDIIASNIVEEKIKKMKKVNYDFYAIWTLDKNLLKADEGIYSPILVFTGEISKI